MNAINADYLLEFVKRFEELSDIKKKERNVHLYLDAPMLRYAIEKFPVHYDVEVVRHGKWVREHKPNSKNNGRFYCSECLGYLPFNRMEPKTNYCPSCGAKMDLKE